PQPASNRILLTIGACGAVFQNELSAAGSPAAIFLQGAMPMSGATNESLQVFSVLVENEFGVLARVAGLFASRSFNIESLTVGPTHDSTMSRMTILVRGNPTLLNQVEKQLQKLIEVVAVGV